MSSRTVQIVGGPERQQALVTDGGRLQVETTPASGAGTSDVNIEEVGGVAVTTSVPTNIVGGGHAAVCDEYNPALTVQSELHTNIHLGHMYHASYVESNIGNGAYTVMSFTPDPSKDVHMRLAVAVSQMAQVDLFESSELNLVSGIALESINRNREKAAVLATLQVTQNPGIILVGDLLMTSFIPSASARRSGGGALSVDDEWLFDPGKQYLLRVTNLANQNARVNIVADWYEKTE